MNNKIKTYHHDGFNDNQTIYAFTGRRGGVSEGQYNSLNLAYHVGDDIKKAEENRTSLKEFPIMTLFADCIPILLHDPEKNIAATIHAGWKGTYLEIAKKVFLMESKFGKDI